jgi:hypothetical protein
MTSSSHALLSQLTTHQDVLMRLRNRVTPADAAHRALEEARNREWDRFAHRLEDLLLQLAQVSAARETQARDLEDALKEVPVASLAAQTARLRNDLRLHLEKLRAGEDVMKVLLEKVEVKETHINSLRTLSEQLSKFEQEHPALLSSRTGCDELLANLRAQVLALKEKR